jgi:hypothetical protein
MNVMIISTALFVLYVIAVFNDMVNSAIRDF